MNKPYIEYETCLVNKTVISVRADATVSSTDYYRFLGNIIIINAKHIDSIEKPHKFICGSMCTIIRFNQFVRLSN